MDKLDSDTPRTQLSKQLAKTKLSVRPALGDISNRNKVKPNRSAEPSIRSQNSIGSQNSSTDDSRCATPTKPFILSPIIEHESPPRCQFNGSLFSPIASSLLETPSPLATRLNLSGGFSTDLEDAEVSDISRLSDISGFCPIVSDSDSSSPVHPALRKLPTEMIQTQSRLKRKRLKNSPLKKTRTRTQSVSENKRTAAFALDWCKINLAKCPAPKTKKRKTKSAECLDIQLPDKPLPDIIGRNLRERAASINPKPTGFKRFNTCIEYGRSQSTIPISHDLELDNNCLKPISVEQVSKIVSQGRLTINNKHFTKYQIIDARYSYEYEDGHIKGALSVPKVEEDKWQNELRTRFFETKKKHDDLLIIFHCEFSSARGPELRQWFRRYDRDANQYPDLFYPHLYLMTGGFKAFHENILDQSLFHPARNYVPERDSRFSDIRNQIKKKKKQKMQKQRNAKTDKRILRSATRKDAILQSPQNGQSTPVRKKRRVR